MKEYLTDAIILNIKPVNEQDNLVDLYTKDFGRIRARVTSGRKILSKLSPHLDPLNLVKVRLVEKKQFIVADTITLDRFEELRKSRTSLGATLELVNVLRSLLFSSEPDLRLWHWLNLSLKKREFKYGEFLKILGYDAKSARCEICGSGNVSHFSTDDQSFICYRCHTKFPKTRLLYIK